MAQTMIRALAVTISNRAAAGIYQDRSGPVLVDLLRSAGCAAVDGPLVIPDGDAVAGMTREQVQIAMGHEATQYTKVDGHDAVSYTHLTLPTIYSV